MKTALGCLIAILSACTPQREAAMSRGVCGDHKTVKGALTQVGETEEGTGVDRQSGEIFQLTVGPHGWSFVSHNRFGASCMVASGQEWKAAK